MLIKSASNGKEINLTSDNTVIKSTNFNVDKNGNMTCNNAQFNGGKIKLNSSSSLNNFIIGDEYNYNNDFTRMKGNDIEVYCVKTDCQVSIDTLNKQIFIADPSNVTFIYPTGITTPSVTQTSLEGIKKNISIYNENALETILNSDIYTYNLKSEKDTDNKHIGFVIGGKYKTPKEIINNEGNAIELYSAIGILWKGMQEHIQEQQKIIGQLQEKIKEMEGKINEKN